MKVLILFAAACAGFIGVCEAAPAPLDDFLRKGQLKEALAAYAQPTTDAERFSLALTQVLDGVQHFSASLNRLSMRPGLGGLELLYFRSAVLDKPAGEARVATPAAVAALFTDFRAALLKANATLAQVEGKEEFGVTLNLSEARADFSGDGTITPETETVMAAFGGLIGMDGEDAKSPVVLRFDRADAAWLRGYTFILSGTIDLLAAYDWSPVWAQCAHRLFLRPVPLPAMAKMQETSSQMEPTIADLIAALHEMRLELIDKDGPRRFRDSILAMAEQSRLCWKRTLAETDNEHEWLPNPRQTGPGGAKVTQEQIDAWFHVLDEVEAIARGKKLLPHWLMKSPFGINVDKLVSAPPKLDLVLWVQGSALVPYVEEGPVSDLQRWEQLTAPFGDFFRFAIWSN